MSFIDYLVQRGLIRDEDRKAIIKQAGEDESEQISTLEARGLSAQEITSLRADFLNVPFKAVDAESVPIDILKYIPEEAAVHYKFAPIGLVDNVLEVGIVEPDNLEARDALQFIASKLNLPFKVFLISQGDFNQLLNNYKSLTGEVHKALSELDTDLIDAKAAAKETSSLGRALGFSGKTEKPAQEIRFVEDTPVTKIVAVMLRHATEGNASDIHIEHTGEKVRIRFRVDGVLYTSLFLPLSVHNQIIARIKVLSNLKLDEKRKPQDGSFSATIEGRKIDIRVSTFPAYYGEKIVMRLLDPEKGVKHLEETGLTERSLKQVREALDKPYGLILLTGPTGSGKSTTLYAMLNELDREKNNVVSLEDPVEYNIEGVAQSQVRPEIGYTFATGLRHILRQDPDIIMVGEIRDKETAQLAIHAALTGHLVFSTIHTNNAAGVIPRLVDMGIDPYLIAPTLIMALGQRLVPVICPSARKAIPVEGKMKERVLKLIEGIDPEFRKEIPLPKTVHDAVPAPDCPGGVRGRMGVYEILWINHEIEKIILENPVEAEIMKAARKQGMITMKEDALIKSIKGLVPFREIDNFE